MQQFGKHGPIELPAQGEAEQIAVTWQWITLIGEQPPHVHIRSLREGCPDNLITQAGDPNGIGAREGQHSLQGTGLRHRRIEEQDFLVQLGSPGGLDGGLGGVNGRL